MAFNRFIGTADAVAQVDNLTVDGTIEVGDIFNITVTGIDGTQKTITYTAVDTVIATVVAGLKTAWDASTSTLCTTVTSANASPILTLTANTAGVGFSVTVETTEAGGGAADDQTFGRSEGTHNSGSGEWEIATNWSAGEIPGASASADVYVEGATILYGLAQSEIVNTLDSLTVSDSQIGSNNADGFFPSYLDIKSTTVNINKHGGPGTVSHDSPVNIDTGTVASTITTYDSGRNSPTTKPSINILANSASTTVNMRKGIAGIATNASETATIGTLNIDYVDNPKTDVEAFIGSGVTITTLTKNGGSLTSLSAPTTTLTNNLGDVVLDATGAITTVTCNAGTIYADNAGTITTAQADKTGTIDFTRTANAHAVTNMKVGKGATIKYNPATMTLGAGKVQSVETTGSVTIKGQ
jgi:hypothetical protein